MKNVKEKGITLIALVVTVIILLILAGVTVGMATSGTGLFEKAKEATEKYQNAQKDEEMQIAKYMNEVDAFSRGGESKQYKETILYEGPNTEETITFANNHTIDEFDTISFLYGIQTGNGWGSFFKVEYKTSELQYVINNMDEDDPYILGLYGYDFRNIEFSEINNNGFKIVGSSDYSIALITGTKY